MNRIISVKKIVPNTYELVLDAPEVAASARPGQFAVVIPDERGERIPLTLADWNTNDGTVTLYFLELGVSTMKLARKQAGQWIDFFAPLGKPATIEKHGTVFIAGGCYGIGAIYPILKALKEAGNRVITVIEARSKTLLYNEERLKKYSDEFVIATTDGGAGIRGKAKTVLGMLVKDGVKIDVAYFIGCTFMMMISTWEAKVHGIRSLVYLNPLILDATGMCGVCRVSVGGETKFCCVDGPEFPGDAVNWEQLFERKNQYVPQQTLIYQCDKIFASHRSVA